MGRNVTSTHSPRTLRSKKLRALVWAAAEGRCQICGDSLDPDHWHADHIVPWVVQLDTNVHEMQALCPHCNRKKGFQMLRTHQRDFDTVCRAILAGQPINRIIVSVTPGGGKSLLPVIATHRLIPTCADAICWVVPKHTLQRQAEQVFMSRVAQDVVGCRASIRASTNDLNPCRGHAGYVTTYQAIHAAHTIHTDEFRRKRYILVLDEPHHIGDDRAWQQTMQDLVDAAVLVILMSGTFERGDGRRVAFLPYRSDGDAWVPDMTPTDTTAVVQYTRTDALREHAIKPLHFYPMDGECEWISRSGDHCAIESLAEGGDYTSDALYTALSTGYATQLLDRCVADWRATQAMYPHSKLLVVAANTGQAQIYLRHLHAIGVHRSAIATHRDPLAAQESIANYKLPPTDHQHHDALVTVAMAYEGLDVPAISHIACLTHIRSTPWIEQMSARAVRVVPDVPYGEQLGHIYGPDDPLLWQCFQNIIAEQTAVVREREVVCDSATAASDPSDSPSAPAATILPLSSAVTGERACDLTNGDTMSAEETMRVRGVLADLGLDGVLDPIRARILARQLSHPDAPSLMDETEDPPSLSIPHQAGAHRRHPSAQHGVPSQLTPSERELGMRRRIEQRTRQIEAASGWEHGTLNGAIRRQFGKSRPDMTEGELQQVWRWLQHAYPGG